MDALVGLTIIIAFILQLAASLSALAYGYGYMGHRIKTLERDSARAHDDNTEIFARMGALERIAARLEQAGAQWERVLNNGVLARIQRIDDRQQRIEAAIARMQQRCEDLHK